MASSVTTTATDCEATTAAADTGWNLPTDVFVEILLRLPPANRWRLRIVSRHWRDVIREQTPAPVQPTALAFVVNYAEGTAKAMSASAYAIDDPAGGRCRELWRSNNVRPVRYYNQRYHRHEYDRTFDTAMVGTCNGVLCLCDNTVPGGAISLANPATGEALAVPPLPGSVHWRIWGTTISSWHEAYAFAYDPDAARYAVVHVPGCFDQNGAFGALKVFTPGPAAAASWRDVPVPAPGASCRLAAGLVGIGSALHWLTEGTERVVSFDLVSERVTSALALPAAARPDVRWRLAEVHGRLGVVGYGEWWNNPDKNDVWVLGGGGGGGRDGRQGWSRRYSVQAHGVPQRLAAPHFAHGEYVLTTGSGVFAHKMRDGGRVRRGEVGSVRISEETPGVRVSGLSGGDGDSIRILRVFAYVKNEEPFRA